MPNAAKKRKRVRICYFDYCWNLFFLDSVGQESKALFDTRDLRWKQIDCEIRF